MTGLPARRRAIAVSEVTKFANSQRGHGNLVPNRSAFQGAAVLARADGLFVMRIDLDAAQVFDKDDLDELAYVVSMVAKARLGHTHFHHHLPGRGRTKPLKPTSVLELMPVQLKGSGWPRRFRSGQLTDADLASAIAENPNAPAGEPARHAVTCLRRAYLNIIEAVHFRLVMSRQAQLSRGPFTLVGIPGIFGITVLVTAVLAMAVTSMVPMSWEQLAALGREMRQVPMVLVALSVGFAYANMVNIVRWHGPALNLMRAAHGFFSAAQPLNGVIARLGVPGMVAGADRFDFSAILESLASKIGGEENRVARQTTWLTVFIGTASLFTAIYAITDARRNGHDPVSAPPAVRQEPLQEQAPTARAPDRAGSTDAGVTVRTEPAALDPTGRPAAETAPGASTGK